MGLLYLWNIPTEIVTGCVLLVHKTQTAWTGTSQIRALVWIELSDSLHNSEVMVRVLCILLLIFPPFSVASSSACGGSRFVKSVSRLCLDFI